MTRLDDFLRAHAIRPAYVAREAGISRQYLLRLRKGGPEPTRSMMRRVARGCSLLLRRPVRVAELFVVEFEETP